MWQRNKGQKESEVLQNQFTAYLTTAVTRCRNDYITQLTKLTKQQAEYLTDNVSSKWYMEDRVIEKLPMQMQLENAALFLALKKLNERERYVLIERVLEEKSFKELAQELGLSYKGVAAVYYRAVQKSKKFMEEDL